MQNKTFEKTRPQISGAFKWIAGFCIFALYFPLVTMVISSFLTTGEDPKITFDWYAALFQDSELWQALGRSLLIAFFTGLITTFIGLWGALALHQWGFKLRPVLQILSLISLIIPELVLALSLLSWFSVLHFQLSLWTVVIAHVTLTLPFATLVMGARLQNFDGSLFEAARDLGATPNQIVLKITLPLMKPALVSAFLLSFLLSFDDFLVTFFTNGVGGDTLPIKLYTQMKIGLSPKLSALSSVMLLVSSVLILVIFRIRGFELFKKND